MRRKMKAATIPPIHVQLPCPKLRHFQKTRVSIHSDVLPKVPASPTRIEDSEEPCKLYLLRGVAFGEMNPIAWVEIKVAQI